MAVDNGLESDADTTPSGTTIEPPREPATTRIVRSKPALTPTASPEGHKAEHHVHHSRHTSPPRPPVAGESPLRGVLAVSLAALALLTLTGGVLMLLLWRQERSSGVLTNQVDRTWNLFDDLGTVEQIVAVVALVAATSWMALALVNVSRVAARSTLAALMSLTLPASIAGVMVIRSTVVIPSEDWIGAAGGIALQALVLVFPLIALEYGAGLVDARRRPHRAAYVIGVLLLAHFEFLGGLSTVEFTDDADEWGLFAAYLVLAALLQVLGAMAANETCRSFQEAAEHRFESRRAFGETVVAQQRT
ncbi:MAG TPA: hypothetical protein VGK49_01170 [Ilumatobacteraceae bacterium]